VTWQLLAPLGPFGAPSAESLSFEPLDPTLAARAFLPGAPATSDNRGADAAGLQLFGVRLAADPGRSTAILGNAGASQASFAIGDQVAAGVTLASVGPGHVVLSQNGARRRLSLPEAPVAAVPAAVPLASSPPANASPGTTEAVDPAQLLQETGLRPRLSNGQADGYTVIPRGDGSALRRAGLRPGDVLLTVNGQALNPERMSELGDMLGSQASMVVTIERDGKQETLTLQMEPP
jgi:general secretion pathway protein C